MTMLANGWSGYAPSAVARSGETEERHLVHGYSVVIPAVNEADSVGAVVRRVREVMASTGEPFEVVVVDDGSTDRTAEEAANAGARVLRHPENAGYGAGLKTGIANAQYDHIVITDADGTYPVDRIPDLIAYSDRYDMVVGARQGKYYRESLIKEPSRLIFGWLCQWVTGTRIPDPNSGLRVFRTALARQYFHIISQGFSFTTTITLAALSNGYFIKYVPIDYYKRVGKSKVKLLRDVPRTTQIILQAIAYHNPIKLFLTFAMACLVLAVVCGVIFGLTRSTAFGVAAGLWSVSVVHFIALGLFADMLRVRHVPRAPTLTSLSSNSALAPRPTGEAPIPVELAQGATEGDGVYGEAAPEPARGIQYE
ncbi:MAG TPA: glycosyltransferase family 2 protein [Chloroflexota bacterium]|nr:glycosyltransferase family 2 protein [Chloroflexota bacterium]